MEYCDEPCKGQKSNWCPKCLFAALEKAEERNRHLEARLRQFGVDPRWDLTADEAEARADMGEATTT